MLILDWRLALIVLVPVPFVSVGAWLYSRRYERGTRQLQESWAEASTDHKLTILEATELGVRVELVLEWAKQLLAELKVTERIRQDVTEGMEKQQRDFLLRQQLAAIRKELGEGDEDGSDDYRFGPPPRCPSGPHRRRQVERMERPGPRTPSRGGSAPGWTGAGLPWGTTTEDNFDLTAAREVLDADHYGLAM
jgi:ATP-dependent Lon protease